MPKCVVCRADSDCMRVIRSFHTFPRDEVMRNRWMTALNLTSITKRDTVCAEHFPAGSFKLNYGHYQRRLLKRDAVPQLDSEPQIELTAASNSEQETEPDIGLQCQNNKIVESILIEQNSLIIPECFLQNPSKDKVPSKINWNDHHYHKLDVEGNSNDVIVDGPIVEVPFNQSDEERDSPKKQYNAKRYFLSIKKSRQYLSQEDFVTQEAWERFQKHMESEKIRKEEARKKQEKSDRTIRKYRNILQHLATTNRSAEAALKIMENMYNEDEISENDSE